MSPALLQFRLQACEFKTAIALGKNALVGQAFEPERQAAKA